ncbi:hypothetical protein R3X27_23260 [Tropicimonas sp. TH_r6]|uniref:hypothetical protein n=1 Tax=Tropicimonas sp. TH_r6 TaxID=3082085 RepID=UPI002952DDD9|nr:hypothetical protein [Tropicimonas sp. TH_r6]MDV7145612.1 hypothetical protein [Tropicimonas sp. TH_r6]
MTVSTESIGRIRAIARTLEEERNTLSQSLATPECSGGAKDVERSRLEDLHRRITGALSALNGEARDW